MFLKVHTELVFDNQRIEAKSISKRKARQPTERKPWPSSILLICFRAGFSLFPIVDVLIRSLFALIASFLRTLIIPILIFCALFWPSSRCFGFLFLTPLLRVDCKRQDRSANILEVWNAIRNSKREASGQRPKNCSFAFRSQVVLEHKRFCVENTLEIRVTNHWNVRPSGNLVRFGGQRPIHRRKTPVRKDEIREFHCRPMIHQF